VRIGSKACLLSFVLLLLEGADARAFLGVGDTSLVTVVANPAESANWAAELARLTAALEAAQGTLSNVETLRGYAGDPQAAVRALSDLGAISTGTKALAGTAATDTDLRNSWQSLGAAGRLDATTQVLASSGAGSGMIVFGQQVQRNAGLYQGFAQTSAALSAVLEELSLEQGARASSASELDTAWTQFRAATTESQKQAILAEVVEIQAQDQAMTGRRRALMDDMDLADRQGRLAARTREAAADETLLAESSALNTATGDRARASEAARIATLQKPLQDQGSPDYSGLRLWTTADTEGASP
jgi:hypothetical protein